MTFLLRRCTFDFHCLIEKKRFDVFLIIPGVYAFGFLFMLPQLFVNYKVSSSRALTFHTILTFDIEQITFLILCHISALKEEKQR